MFFVSAFLKDILEMIYQFVGNYGWSVVIFTLLIRMVVLPLDIKSKKSMKRMSALQPKTEALQKKYANDKEKLNVKLNELYRKEKVSPMSGCLPMLLSMPILICMFDAMRVLANEHTVKLLLDMMNDTFDPALFQPFLWIKNIYQPDSFLATIIPAVGDKLANITNINGSAILTMENLEKVREFLTSDKYAEIAAQFGANRFIYEAPVLFWNIQIPAQVNGYMILPVVAALSQFLSTKLMSPPNQSAQAQQQSKMMNYFFPIFSLWICTTYTAAFALYWVAGNLIQIVQQYFVNMYFDKQNQPKPEEVLSP